MTTVSNFGVAPNPHHSSNTTISGMPNSPGSCLQQRDSSGYSCMSRPTYEPLSLAGSYGARPTCSPTQPYQHMNGVAQYTTNGTSSTGKPPYTCAFQDLTIKYVHQHPGRIQFTRFALAYTTFGKTSCSPTTAKLAHIIV